MATSLATSINENRHERKIEASIAPAIEALFDTVLVIFSGGRNKPCFKARHRMVIGYSVRHCSARDRRVDLRCLNRSMTEKNLNRAEIGSRFKQSRRTAMTEAMRIHGFTETRFF
jgi:hypothetical protein